MLRARLETVKEDAAECWIFADSVIASGDATYIDGLYRQIRETIAELTHGYLWHKDSFNVYLPPTTSNEELPPNLYSLTYYGDNIEDEWFIVYILLEISKKYPGVVVRVRDNDGEFLLIEAADALPAWATPDTTENRVFIFNGDIHLITPDLLDVKKSISIREALDCIKSNSHVTKASDNIQAAIRKRIQGYPQRIMESLHRAIVRMPAKFATVLKMEPALIAQAVNAYCSRDTMESNICKQMDMENCVDTTVTFTKCLYAMLTHASTLNRTSWKLPSKSSNDYKKNMLGFKLACGFEILMSKASQDMFASKQWKTYLESLKKNGYFKENIEGSKDYMKLLDDSKQYFLSIECSNINPHIGNSIQQMINTTQFEEIFKNIFQTEIPCDEDSDDWLTVNPEELNNMMSDRYGTRNTFSKGDTIITPQTITDQMSSFLKKSSDFEGIEVDRDGDDDEANTNNEERIEFDYQQFTDKVKHILDLVVPEDDWNLDTGTDLSDYSSDDDLAAGMPHAERYQCAMDHELSDTTLGQSFVNDGKTVDVSKNTFTNLLQSVKEEMGSSGPSSNLLANIGFNKNNIQPLDSDDEEAD